MYFCQFFTANIFVLLISGVVARHPAILPYLKQALTEDAVHKYFAHFMDGETSPTGKAVQRFKIISLTFFIYIDFPYILIQ